MTVRTVVAGAASCYTTLRVDEFPLSYEPTAPPTWAHFSVSGAATHIARVQAGLGCDVRLCTVVGEDVAGQAIRSELCRGGLLGAGVVASESSSLGIVLVDRNGRRMGMPYLAPVDGFAYPFPLLREQARDADLLVLTNARFVRPLVEPAATLGIPIAVDVHLIAELDDEYGRPWLEHARIVFCSHERLPGPRAWIAGMFARYKQCEMVGVGLGPGGAMLGLRDGTLIRVAAAPPPQIINTSGAGDALFGTFLAEWLRNGDPVAALQSAVLHAGWKIGHRLPATASLPTPRLTALRERTPPPTRLGRWDRWDG
ncbi:sugar/nucleoside kinase (ribokinase family) [Actinomadura pelletieri DSM 43383]|uniref:Sugar/nucleoside kinase (Ribokinase family) n=1 Tax=Actinomadura pelletieri DSM 43383 TaxID=1120940 RepID=A0A495R0R9_9ACTN|nr:carbohydrate kinase family protein [Actinomadura pelletieri]RKS79706.1 sugar/nucleoside kinase (ribokinase family) [Actinomadura pelletieri DSM 43383]